MKRRKQWDDLKRTDLLCLFWSIPGCSDSGNCKRSAGSSRNCSDWVLSLSSPLLLPSLALVLEPRTL